jgi:hypothetical protein
MKVGNALQDRLARSLDEANTREAKARRLAPKVPAPLPGQRRCRKLAVSLFPPDHERVKAIRAYILAERGVSISTSAVIRLALRTAPLSTGLCKALDQATGEDGRK